ncbi:MAG: MmcQ/YjbR family DNA-binding protein [Lachnospiraceae bacterium]|nr:MmcQ/YjbR family DNA-binding protein [Lachnospiraceae bacterium]
MFEEQYFKRRKMNVLKLLQYGFIKETDSYTYGTTIMDGQFLLRVCITDDGAVSTEMIDCMSNEEYMLYKVSSSVGAFVGEARAACGNVLMDISEKCFEPDIFHCEQTLAIIEFVREKYGDELEFLWSKYSDNAVWRRKDSKKWYGAVLKVSRKKLGLFSEETAEIIDLRLEPEQMAETVDGKRYFPGWHMNKKSWYTIILDGSVSVEEICRRIDDSYALAVK